MNKIIFGVFLSLLASTSTYGMESSINNIEKNTNAGVFKLKREPHVEFRDSTTPAPTSAVNAVMRDSREIEAMANGLKSGVKEYLKNQLAQMILASKEVLIEEPLSLRDLESKKVSKISSVIIEALTRARNYNPAEVAQALKNINTFIKLCYDYNVYEKFEELFEYRSDTEIGQEFSKTKHILNFQNLAILRGFKVSINNAVNGLGTLGYKSIELYLEKKHGIKLTKFAEDEIKERFFKTVPLVMPDAKFREEVEDWISESDFFILYTIITYAYKGRATSEYELIQRLLPNYKLTEKLDSLLNEAFDQSLYLIPKTNKYISMFKFIPNSDAVLDVDKNHIHAFLVWYYLFPYLQALGWNAEKQEVITWFKEMCTIQQKRKSLVEPSDMKEQSNKQILIKDFYEILKFVQDVYNERVQAKNL